MRRPIALVRLERPPQNVLQEISVVAPDKFSKPDERGAASEHQERNRGPGHNFAGAVCCVSMPAAAAIIATQAIDTTPNQTMQNARTSGCSPMRQCSRVWPLSSMNVPETHG